MSLDKSRIPKRGNSSRKFIPEEQRKSMTFCGTDQLNKERQKEDGFRQNG